MSQDIPSGPKPNSSPSPGSTNPPAVCPDCRAKRMNGIEAFTECLTPAPGNCPFLFIYGHGRFCTHPLREQIVRQS